MARLALGRAPVMLRNLAPYPSRPETQRIIPPEPDELWDAIALQARNSALLASIQVAGETRAVGQLQEFRRNQQRLGLLIERLSLDGNTFDDRVVDTPAVVQAVKLAALSLEEKPDATSVSNPDDFVVSIRGRGFPFMDEFWVRGEYTDGDGELRAFPMVQTAQTTDLASLEFSAGTPLSTFQVEPGSVVVLVLVLKLQSARFVTRAFERFTVG